MKQILFYMALPFLILFYYVTYAILTVRKSKRKDEKDDSGPLHE